MLTFENQNIEFKQEYVPDIRKEVMGFAEGIREMILQNSGRSFEQCRSMNQELTFHTLQTLSLIHI